MMSFRKKVFIVKQNVFELSSVNLRHNIGHKLWLKASELGLSSHSQQQRKSKLRFRWKRDFVRYYEEDCYWITIFFSPFTEQHKSSFNFIITDFLSSYLLPPAFLLYDSPLFSLFLWLVFRQFRKKTFTRFSVSLSSEKNESFFSIW